MLSINQVYLTDCMEGFRQLESGSVDMILTDIPYNHVNRHSNGLRNLDKEQADILTFDLKSFVSECVRVCKGTIYIFCSTEQVSDIRSELISHQLTTRHCIWEKTNPSPMNGEYLWLSSIENCIYARKKNAPHHAFCKSAVWRFPNGKSKQHPTEKPLKLFEYLIQASSNKGDVILDPCIGSGTTAIASLLHERNYIGFEINPTYFEIAHERMERFHQTGVQFSLFDELE